MAKQLRFAALVRVSTEQQEKKGESCRTQTTLIEHCVKVVGGTVAAWYRGQEHATPDQERVIFNRLLEDASKTKRAFNAIIVSNHSRWSRNNADSKKGLEILRRSGVRLFVGMNEYDLDDFNARFVLGIQTEIAERDAAEKKWDSIQNRIHRAERGVPTAGKLPFGRIWNNEKGKWEIDAEKQALVKDIARRYLAGEKMSDLAKEYGMNHASLHKTMTKRCGTDWKIQFKVADLKIDKTIPFTIPRLLDEKTIKAILKQASANKTYEHGQAKHNYLLTGFLFCEHCGYAMSGTPNQRGDLYYRHSNAKKLENLCPHPNFHLPAAQIEELVIRHLFDCFGNAKALQKAIDEATPNNDKLTEYHQQCEKAEKELARVKAGRERLIRLIVKGTLSDADAEKGLSELSLQEVKLTDKIQSLREAIDTMPSEESVRDFSEMVAGKMRTYGNAVQHAKLHTIKWNFAVMTYEEKRALVKMVFDGKMVDRDPMGVYVHVATGEENKRSKRWKFYIRGHVEKFTGTTPWGKTKACVAQHALY